jgi:hypothetical protein
MSTAPILWEGLRDPRVVTLREKLNVPGDDLFDLSLTVLVRGLQTLHGIIPTGMVDEETAEILGMV